MGDWLEVYMPSEAWHESCYIKSEPVCDENIVTERARVADTRVFTLTIRYSCMQRLR